MVQHMCMMIFIFTLGRWLGADMYLGIYINTLVPAERIVWVIAAILAGTKLLFSIPAGYINQNINNKYTLIVSKWLYVITGILYFLAGATGQRWIILIAVVCNGIANPLLYTGYYTLIREYSSPEQATKSFALFHTCMQMGYIVWAIIISIWWANIPLQYMFLAIAGTSLLTLMSNTKSLENTNNKRREAIEESIMHETHVYEKVANDLKEYNETLYMTLIMQMLYGCIDYISMIFIPLIAADHNLSLSQIAIIFALNRAPHIASLLLSNALHKNIKNTFVVTTIIVTILWSLMAMIGFTKDFTIISIGATLIGLGLATIRPILLWFISSITQARHRAEIVWVQEFCTRIGEIVWSSAIAIGTAIGGLGESFFILWSTIIIVSMWLAARSSAFRIPLLPRYTKQKFRVLNIIEKFSHKLLHKTT